MTAGTQHDPIPGRAFPARSSRETQAELILRDDLVSLVEASGDVIAACPPQQLSWDMPVGQTPRRVNFPDGSLFEATDNAAIDAIRHGSGWSRLHRSERFGRRLLLVVAATIAGAFLLWRFALPGLVSVAVILTPEPVRDLMDESTIAGFDRTFAEPSTLEEDRKAEVLAVFEALQAALPPDLQERDYRLLFRSAPAIGPNAFALPGGTVLITDQLVTKFEGDDVVAGVLAHELGHVTGDHGLRQLYRSLGVYVLVALLAGDTGPILEDVLLEGGVLLSLSHSREHERDADGFGMRLASEAGYDPSGLLAFFETLPDAEDTSSDWFSTHPASGERMEAIQEFLDSR